MSYAEAAAKGPKQSPEEVCRSSNLLLSFGAFTNNYVGVSVIYF
jgi:hypothetical protein